MRLMFIVSFLGTICAASSPPVAEDKPVPRKASTTQPQYVDFTWQFLTSEPCEIVSGSNEFVFVAVVASKDKPSMAILMSEITSRGYRFATVQELLAAIPLVRDKCDISVLNDTEYYLVSKQTDPPSIPALTLRDKNGS